MRPPRIIVSGGGTGGHIFPAIAIANAIKNLHPDAAILFVGAIGRMEMEKVPAAGYDIEGLWISGLQRNLSLQNLAFPFKVVSSLLKARKIIKSFKPDIAIGVGGYASGPLLKAAGSMGVATMIQEQNSFPGITNKMLAQKADRICVAYDHMNRWFPDEKITKTGNPVRRKMVEISGKRELAIQHFGLDPNKRTVFCMGGSLGARTINHSVANMLEKFGKNDIQLIWQTGKLYHQQALEDVSTFAEGVICVKDFIYEMDLAYAAADVIVSRAGAMSISELCLIGKPAILVPLPSAAEDHQTKNAQALVDENAAVLIPDSLCRELLPDELMKLLADTQRQENLGRNILKMAMPDADTRIAKLAMEIIQKKKS